MISSPPEDCSGEAASIVHPRPAIPPHEGLPADILREIFSYSIPREDSGVHVPPLKFSHGPWPLRQVCSAWRQIASSYNPLWRSLSISDTDYLFDSLLLLILDVLPSNGPLKLSFGDRQFLPYALVENIIKPNIARIVSLQICANLSIGISFLSLNHAHFESLLSLTVSGRDHISYPGHRRFGDLQKYPALQTLVICLPDVPNFTWVIRNDNEKWSNLTSLFVKRYPGKLNHAGTFTGLPAVLSQCPNLIFLHIYVAFNIRGGPFIPPIVLSKLQTLELLVAGRPEYPVLDFMTLPSLRTLRVETDPRWSGGSCPMQKLINLIKRSSCSTTLTHINNFESIPFYDVEDDDEVFDHPAVQFDLPLLEELFIHFPAIKTLRLPLWLDPEKHLRRFVRQGYLSQLESLGFWVRLVAPHELAGEIDTVCKRLKEKNEWTWGNLQEICIAIDGWNSSKIELYGQREGRGFDIKMIPPDIRIAEFDGLWNSDPRELPEITR